MEGNLFADLITKMREDMQGQITDVYKIGKIVSDNPLKVEVGGTVQDKSSLLMANNLYIGDEILKLKRASDGVEIDYYPPSKLKLSKNDTILLIPIEEQQRFIIVGKVVKA